MKPELNLPSKVQTGLTEFVAAAREGFGSDLRAVVLYGSGAESKLRPTSDVNVILVLASFDQKKADQLREPLRLAQAAIQLRAMFLLESELQAATEAFAVKFADIFRRRVVLYGDDPFKALGVSRDNSVFRLKQTLLNLILRMREAYISRGLREEQLVATVADVAGPLRSCAAILLELEGKPAASAKEALEQISPGLPHEAVTLLSEARQKRSLPPGVAASTLFHLIELACSMKDRAATLK
jgi:predicted nucleotidyltransferase